MVTWIDANAPYHDAFVNKRAARPPYGLPDDRQLLGKIAAVHAKRCGACHEPAGVTRAYWIDIHRPAQSLFLTAPLASTAGGAEGCGQAVYQNHSDPDYRAVLELVDERLVTFEEGKFSMFIDAVERKCGPSSYCDESEMKSFEKPKDMLEMFRSY